MNRGLFSVKARGELVIKAVDRLARTSEETIKSVLAKGAIDLQREIKANIKKQHAIDTGNLWRSVQIKTKEGGLVKEVIEQADYGVYVERGTKKHFPPVKALELWAKRRGLNVYAVVKAIGKKGTKAKPHFIPALRTVLPEIFRNLERVMR